MYISEERCEAELARNREWRQDKSKERHEKERARKRAWRQTIILSRERREVGKPGKSRHGGEKIISFFHNFCWKFRSAAWKIHTEVRGRRLCSRNFATMI